MYSLNKSIKPLFLLKFTLPSIVMMAFNSFYTMVDGGFVANYINTTALSAVNIAFPFLSFAFAIGIMLASGGSAIVAKQLGEGQKEKARASFSLVTLACGVLGVVIGVIGLAATEPLLRMMGADDTVLPYCMDYIRYLSLFIPLAAFQVIFQFFFVTAGRPALGLVATLIGGCVNMLLDYVFMAQLGMGIKGAAIATGIGFAVPAVVGFVWFFKKSGKDLFFDKPSKDMRVLLHSCSNGISEMVTNLAVAVTTVLFNITMMRMLGADGVAALTIVLYAQFLFSAVFMGYTAGVAPLVSFNYGAQKKERLQKLYKYSLMILISLSVLAFTLSVALADVVVGVFARQGTAVFDLAVHGMDLFAVSFLLMGVNIFSSGFFTAFSNGKVSAIISFLRTFLFIVAAVFILPIFLSVDGIWLAIPVAEALGLLVTIYFFKKYKKVYGY